MEDGQRQCIYPPCNRVHTLLNTLLVILVFIRSCIPKSPNSYSRLHNTNNLRSRSAYIKTYTMEITSLPLFNADTFLAKRRKLDDHFDQESLNEIFDLLNDEKIPSSRYEVPSSGFENQALEMESLGDGRVRKTSYSAGIVAEGGGGQHRRFWVKERSQGWWKYHDSDECSDVEFRKAFRMSKATFNMICDELEPAITKKDTMLRLAIPVRQRVAVCIYRLATGDPLRTTSSLFGLGIATCHKLVQEVCTAIKTILMPKFIKWPDEERLKETISTFASISGIPNVTGSIYTSHIPIIAPKTNPKPYFNQKHTNRNQKPSYSTTIQALVDPHGLFTDICIGYPGSMTDQQILATSALSHRPNMTIIANSCYSLTDSTLVPYTHQNLTWSQHMFNRKIADLQSLAEAAFMRLKGRWGCLQKRTEVKVQELPMVLGACCVLHNICEMKNEEIDLDLLRFEMHEDHEKMMDLGDGFKVNVSLSAVQARDTIAYNLLHGGGS